MDSIAVILTCHNRREKTLRCLEALETQVPGDRPFTLSVYLVDDHSSDGTSEAVAERFPSVHLLRGTGELYWNRGMHLAWQEAAKGNYDHYLWLNDDTFIESFCVAELLACSGQVQDQAVICASICSAVNGEWTYGGFRIVRHLNVPVHPTGKLEPCDTFNGNCVLVPRHVYEAVGNIDPVFIHAIGDLDYGLRARKKGIASYITTRYTGTCEKNVLLPKWCRPEIPLRDRVKSLYSPLGNSHPYYFFIYENRHFSPVLALKHLFTIHLRLCMPRLWTSSK